MKWLNAFGILLVMALVSGCPSNEPSSPNSPTATPTATATATATCSGVFGESVTTSGANFGTTLTFASQFTLVETAAVTALSIPMEGGETFRVGIYSNSGGAPQSLLAVSSSTVAGALWNTVSVGPVTLSPGSYWLGLRVTNNPGGNTGYMEALTGTYPSCSCDFADPWVAGTIFTGGHLSILARYSCP